MCNQSRNRTDDFRKTEIPNLGSVHLNGLRAVEAVARRGSLLKAAEELGVSPSAVSQQVGRTEKQIGRALFTRTREGLAATEFGAVFAARLSVGFRELTQAVALADDSAAHTLVVSVAPAFASRWLVPRLSRFYAKHFELALRIDATTRLVDFNRSDIDLAIRMGDGQWPSVRAELLLALEIFPVCAPSIAERLKTVADLANEWAICDENSMFTWERWFEAAGAPPVALLPGARFTDPMLCVEAAIAGQGVMLAWQLLVADALTDGRLVAPFGVSAGSGLGYYLATAAGRRPSAKVLAFKRWIVEEVAKTVAEFGARAAAARSQIGARV
ncbi:LysR substrate-binding domain-containing protein [Methylocapsa sp. S129]|uniref:LysR substrate-binding domain-containing protein n=1 Tax=Methylocapsa sp. S129 TaxID=1641869 RepID=UPI00131BCB41|nr:LysR substrate-binding domain-containing protein [Methylocapsa sp. S129]